MRRLAVIAVVLLAPAIPLAPAYAAGNVICVGLSGGTCNETAGTIHDAITAANGNGLSDTIVVAPGVYTDGPYFLTGSTEPITLKGSGEGSTVLTLAASASTVPYVSADQATIQDLTIEMDAGQSAGDKGLSAGNGSVVDHVVVDGTAGGGVTSARGVVTSNSTITAIQVLLPVGAVAGNEGVAGGGGTTITDSTMTGYWGFGHSGTGTPDTLSRVKISAGGDGVLTDVGAVVVDDALIDLGTSPGAAGLAAMNQNVNTTPKSIDANHVTIVGGGSGSIGAYAWANKGTAVQQASITLANSIVRGPETDLLAIAGNNGGLGGNSTATITATYSDWHLGTSTSNANGDAHVNMSTGNVDVDPAFVNAAGGDYRLSAGSLVVDLGNPAAAGPATDLAGAARVTDGDGDGVAVRDMGAYESAQKVVPDTTAPDTQITSHPRKTVTKRRVRFGFVSTEAGSHFQCKLDRHAWESCTSPKTYRVKIGRHRFQVRAIDGSGNVDPYPARFRFRRV